MVDRQTPHAGADRGGDFDAATGQETTGHEWDGIRELDRPLPRWWLWTFYATIVWAIGYVILYPAIPMVTSSTKGLLGYSTRGDVEQQIAAAKTAQAGKLEQIAQGSLEQIQNNPDLLRFAVSGGHSAFQVNCIQCHGSGAAGSPGYPNLNDDEWLWGGTLEDIYTTIRHGIRFTADPDTRSSEMPAFGADGILDRPQLAQVADYVLSLSGRQSQGVNLEPGKQIFADNCAACHGDNGQGNREVGAPALNTAIALYGSDRASILAQVTRPRHGVMPAWSTRLDEATLKELALYVYSLGGGEANKQQAAK
ncbi:cytochrome c oxidase cbb3-type subunit 3 [Rhodoligotrophos appendicifer]|uniref:cytochrome-c oxidase, cbb3-type subunit III n=1 Tax=Rhodoligotrophos appendicifer TaxID=987056 RepID=UPI0011858632|nr:cytochrome-c oxidase, cbb3-type subunit III [Rhodoligotrophos appendicifer]